jgi:hypothetical protein
MSIPAPTLPIRTSWHSPALAACLALLLACVAFGSGIWWQTRSTSHLVAQRLGSSEFSQQLTQVVRQTTSGQMAEYDQSMEAKLSSIAAALVEMRKQDAAADEQTLQRLEVILARLVENQSDLRGELETLALSAESAIATTRRELKVLDEFARSLAGLNQ